MCSRHFRHRELVDRCYPSFTSCRPTHPPAYQISIPISISFGDGSPKFLKSGVAYTLDGVDALKQKIMHIALVSVNASQHTKF